MERTFDITFYKGKKVLVTGHTGFKGSWLCKMLIEAGANVTGYALEPPTKPSLFELAGIEKEIYSVCGDIRDRKLLKQVFEQVQPEIVFHLAAQPLVCEGYTNPAETYEINVMGTINVLECIRNLASVQSVVIITTDKVYYNKEWLWGYREDEWLDGYDPYSNSKSCAELVTHTYIRCFLKQKGIAVSTVRAGNVIGGGDFAANRIIPDCVRAAIEGKAIEVRNPLSVRPYQHVLEALYAYLMIAAKQYEDASIAGAYNVGPNEEDCYHTKKLVEIFIRYWGNGLNWKKIGTEIPHEANWLKLDCSKLKSVLGWKPKWNVEKAIELTVEWSKCWSAGKDVNECLKKQIREYLAL